MLASRVLAIAAAAVWGVWLGVPALAESPILSITETATPTYATRSGFYFQNELLATATGTAWDTYDYTLALGMTNQHGGKNQDVLTGAVGFFYSFEFYRVGITQEAFVRFVPNFFEFSRIALPTRVYLQGALAVVNTVILLEISLGRRNALERPDLERTEVQPEIDFITELGSGVLDVRGEYAIQVYDSNNRIDNNIYVGATWTKALSRRARIGLEASFEQIYRMWRRRDIRGLRWRRSFHSLSAPNRENRRLCLTSCVGLWGGFCILPLVRSCLGRR